MSKKKNRDKSPLRHEISMELDRIRFGQQTSEKDGKGSWARQGRIWEYMLRARMKDVQGKILRHEDYNKQQKVNKKIGGVRGKFHPSLERTRKRT